MSDTLEKLHQHFWCVRGSFKLGGLVNVGTQCALIERPSGSHLFLDSYTLQGDMRDEIMARTNNGRTVEAVLNVHPYHTIHCAQMAQDFPGATFYGSTRHREQVPEVEWADDLVESDAVATRFAELSFSLPRGIAYIHEKEHVHAGSLVVFHPESATLYVDDTFNVLPIPKLVRKMTGMRRLRLHPTLETALTGGPDAGAEFCGWLEEIAHNWATTKTLCAAHSGMLEFEPGEFSRVIHEILDSVRPKLTADRG
nr:hypothetical protein [uncultured Cohaesibacter sp.]